MTSDQFRFKVVTMNNGAVLRYRSAEQAAEDAAFDAETDKLYREEQIATAVAILDWTEAVRVAEVGDDFPPLSDDEHERVSTMLSRDGLDLDDHRVVRRGPPRFSSCWNDGATTLVDAPALAMVEEPDVEHVSDLFHNLRCAS